MEGDLDFKAMFWKYIFSFRQKVSNLIEIDKRIINLYILQCFLYYVQQQKKTKKKQNITYIIADILYWYTHNILFLKENIKRKDLVLALSLSLFLFLSLLALKLAYFCA